MRNRIKYNDVLERWELYDITSGTILAYVSGSVSDNPWELNNGKWPYADGSGNYYQLSAGGTTDSTALPKDIKEGVVAYARGLRLVGSHQDPDQDTGFDVYYGYIKATDSIQSISDIKDYNLQGSNMIHLENVEPGPLYIGDVPAGTFTVVAVPSTMTIRVRKDNGLGAQTYFDVNSGTTGSGSNGTPILIDGVQYTIYGEFNIVSGITTVYLNM